MTNVDRNDAILKTIYEGVKDGSFIDSDEIKMLVSTDISQSLARIADSLEKLVSASKGE